MNNIKELRDKAGKTQSDLAAELGITQGAVAHYEKSRRKPGLDTCRKIASVINRWGCSAQSTMYFPLKTAENHHDRSQKTNHESQAGSLPRI